VSQSAAQPLVALESIQGSPIIPATPAEPAMAAGESVQAPLIIPATPGHPAMAAALHVQAPLITPATPGHPAMLAAQHIEAPLITPATPGHPPMLAAQHVQAFAMTSVDLGALQKAQGIFQTALSEVNTVYNDMEYQQTTLSANWAGETASAFGLALSNYLNDLWAIRNELILIANTLSEQTGIYVNTQEDANQVEQAFSSQQGPGALSGLQF
jgi:uncharacterized protein YukE